MSGSINIFDNKPSQLWQRLREALGGFFAKIGGWFKGLPKLTKILGGAVIVTLVAVTVLGFLVTDKYIHHGRFTIGGVTFTEKDVRAYEGALLAHIESNPDVSFEDDDLYAVAETDLLTNAVSRYYASPEKCGLDVAHEDILIGTRGLLDAEMVNAEFGEPSWTNIKRIRAENVEYKARLQSCVVRTRKILKVAITYADPSYFGAGDEAAERLFLESKERLRREYLPLFEAGASGEDIASRADIDYYTNGIAGWTGGVWTGELPPVVAIGQSITADTGFNDAQDRDYPEFFGDVVRLGDMARTLTEVGQYSDVVVATNGEIAIIRLEEITGEFESWEQMLDKYRAERKNALGRASDAIRQVIAKTAGMAAITDTAYAATYRDICEAASPSGGSWGRSKMIDFNSRFVDDTGATISAAGISVTITYTRNATANDYANPTCTETFTGSGNTINGLVYNCLAETMNAVMELPSEFKGASVRQNAVIADTSGNNFSIVHNMTFSNGQATFSMAAYSNVNGGSANADLVVQLEKGADWTAEGETEIKEVSGPRAGQWTKTHPRNGSDGPMEIRAGETVQWRHKVVVEGNGAPTITANTVSKKGTATVTLSNTANGGTSNITNKTFGDDGMAWEVTTWKAPDEPDAIYCQYLRWSPSAADKTGETTSEVGPPGREQCVKIKATDSSDWQLEGTTLLNGGTVDIQVQPCGTATWTHTLKKVGAVAYPGIVNFEQRRTDGDAYGNGCGGTTPNLKSDSVSSLPATNPYNLPLSSHQVNTFTIQVPAGKRYCQNLGWTVPGEPAKNDQTGRLCATAGIIGGSSNYTSTLRACAVKISSFGGTVEKCADATTAGASAATNYAKTQDEIFFRYEIKRTAAYQSRQSANYKAAPAFDSSKTICGTNSTEAKAGSCTAKTPTAYTRPTTPGGKVTSKPGYLSRMMEDWNITDANDCKLYPPETPYLPSVVASKGGLTPTSGCNATENDLRSVENYEYKGNGHRVDNTDLGLRKAELTQSVSLKDIKITVHRGDTRTYTYEYLKKYAKTCSSDSWCSGGCSSCNPPIPCTPGSCSGSTQNCYGLNCTVTGTCRYGCTSNDGSKETATYTDQDNVWVEVMPDGPIKADVSFAIPYNYTITPELNVFPANADRIQLGGTELGYAAAIKVSPRYNSEVGETYATATRPDTKWAVTTFYVGPNRTANPNPTSNYERTGAGANPCSFYVYDSNGQNGLANTAGGCNSTIGTGSLNTASETNMFDLRNGSTKDLGRQTELIGDVPMGTKFCVSVAVMDKDSTYQNGYGSVSQGVWTVYKPECVVIGKIPMTNVLGDGLYSDGEIEGSTFTKQPHGQSSVGAFGSYGEYEVVSNRTIKTFVSGAALGVGAGGVPLGGSNAAMMVAENTMNGSCQIAILTFGNRNCNTTILSASLGQMSGANVSHGLARNIRHRYTGRTDATIVSGSVTPSSTPCTITASTGGATQCMSYVKANGALTVNAAAIPAGRTVVIEATGAVMINGNITLNDGSYTDIAQVPQVLIFAPSIDIAPNVTRVDAWLMAGLNGGTGTINTCGGSNGVTSVLQLNGNTCANALKISGPVMASRVLLHRTAGAGTGMPNSARPAETFFLSPATYLWAYNQSSNLSQAYLTYTREVAPRF